ncbi:MAG TPA: PA14 domain-containing protein [Planctomycetota bacterium]|nr:PA14 domain-containing protein [Planctomycetota bacterium]
MALNPNQRRVSGVPPKAAAPVRKVPSGAQPVARPAAVRKPGGDVVTETPPSNPTVRPQPPIMKRPAAPPAPSPQPAVAARPAPPAAPRVVRPSGAAPKASRITEDDLEKNATEHDSSTLVAPPAPIKTAPKVEPQPPAKKISTVVAPKRRNEDLKPEIEDEPEEADEPGASGQSSIERAVEAARTPFKAVALGLAAGCILMLAVCTYLFLNPPAAGSSESLAGGTNDAGAPVGAPAAQPRLALMDKPKAPGKPVVNLLRQGATATGGENIGQLLDGNFLNYDGGSGYAYYDFNAQPEGGLVVTLAKAQKMSRVRFLLWDKDARYYSYILYISTDGKKFQVAADCSNKECQSWQEVDFPPAEVKAIKIRGTANSANPQLHVVEVEAYDSPPKAAKLTPPKGGANELACKPGIWAQYYEGTNHYASVADTPFFSRAEKSLGFGALPVPQPNQGLQNWVLQGPCAAVFSGFVKIEKEDLYTFFIESDDGSRLYINGELVADNDGVHGMTEIWGQIDLRPGLHRIWVEYFNAGGGMGLNVSIKPKGGDKRHLGPELFYNPSEAK